jgi:hypothetical protein
MLDGLGLIGDMMFIYELISELDFVYLLDFEIGKQIELI